MKQLAALRPRIYLAALLAAAVVAAGGTAYATTSSPTDHGGQFDFDKGNAIIGVFVPAAEGAITQSIAPNDASIVLHLTVMLSNSWFDATAPYHPTAVGVYSDLGRRPASESDTNRNINTAILYATYRVLNRALPEHGEQWRAMLAGVGLDPDNNSEDISTPAGLGNVAGNAVMDARERDGLNMLGDEGGVEYNRQRYADYTGYQPVNTAYELRNPSRWQPAVVAGKTTGVFRVQQFVTPQLRLTTPYSYDDPSDFSVPPPRESNHRNHHAYKRQADEVLAAVGSLDDQKKMTAELFDNKFLGLGLSTAVTGLNTGLSLLDFVHYHFVLDVASFDTSIAIWNEKYRHDAVRPFSAIRYLYGDDPVTSWGGPGQGTVDDLPATQWRSYLHVADHPEYPSASASFCSAHAQAARTFHGTDQMEFGFQYPQGSSVIEPGITPAQDLALSWTTWTDFEQDCGLSRFWSGVHFMASVEEGQKVGRKIGDVAYDFVRQHIEGNNA